jgi:hypothetical protein
MNDDPRVPPVEPSADGVERKKTPATREELCRAVEHYLSDRFSAFELNERVWDIHGRAADRTIRIIAEQIWYFYDDCTDHQAVLSREEWGLIQRPLLVLKSNAELELCDRRLPHASQGVALATLAAVGWACLAVPTAWPLHFFLSGPISIGLSSWRERRLLRCVQPDPWCMWPFSSFAALRRALNRAPGFRKQKYRAELAGRRIRSADSQFLMQLGSWLSWCMWSPIVLAVQCLPLRSQRFVLVEPLKLQLDGNSTS